jgi:Bifunctional DNA primase/polymerase, N-terminal
MNRPTETASIKEWALYYANLGQPVFPVYEMGPNGSCVCVGGPECKPGKHPRTLHGYLDAATDAAQINTWWDRWPNANIGAPTGSAGLWDVLDVDGQQGAERFRTLLQFYEDQPPDGPRVRTGSGVGLHYFGQPTSTKGTASKIGGPGSKIDWRGEGNYVVLPPSNHASGGRYSWERWPVEVELPEFSPWLVTLAKDAAGVRSKPSTRGKKDPRRSKRGAQQVIHDGEGREADLLSKLGEWRRNGDDPDIIRAAAYAWADKYTDPPLAYETVDKKIDWLWGARAAADE